MLNTLLSTIINFVCIIIVCLINRKKLQKCVLRTIYAKIRRNPRLLTTSFLQSLNKSTSSKTSRRDEEKQHQIISIITAYTNNNTHATSFNQDDDDDDDDEEILHFIRPYAVYWK